MESSELPPRDELVGEAISQVAVPDPRHGFFDDLRREFARETPAPPAGAGRIRTELRRAGPRALVAACLASAVIGGVIGASVSGAANSKPENSTTSAAASTTFPAASGWNTLASTTRIRADSAPVAWAANVPFRPESDYSGFPDNTVKHLPRGGIVISVLGPRPFSGETSFPDISNPLVVTTSNCVTSYEGAPRSDIALCPLDRRLGSDQVLNVMVWIATAAPNEDPSAALLDEANRELARLSLPASA
jgi:hypothetical protein